MTPFFRNIAEQAEALDAFADHYEAASWSGPGLEKLPRRVALTGMGASFQAALWGAHVLSNLGTPAVAVESSELLYFPYLLTDAVDTIVVISQSGDSGELGPLLDSIPSGIRIVGITNNLGSLLGRRADIALDIAAGEETTVACKTFLNTLACLWLLSHLWSGRAPERPLRQVRDIAAKVGELVDDADAIGRQWCDRLLGCRKLVFTGHGPHLPAARQGAMMMGEWVKLQALGMGIGAFRHGPIEFTDDTTGVVLLGGSGVTATSVSLLGTELRSYGATVLCVVEGRLVDDREPVARTMPEILGTLLDVVPMQLFAEQAAHQLGIAPVFRHISKVIARM